MPTKWESFFDKLFEYSLYALVLALPISNAVVEITITLIIIAWIGKRIIRKNYGLPKFPLTKPWLAFLLTCAASLFVAEFLHLGLRAIISKYLTYFLLCVAVYENIHTERVFKNTLIFAAVALTATLLNGYIQVLTGHDILGGRAQFVFIETRDYIRVSSFFGHPNSYGSYLIALLPFTIVSALIFFKQKKHLLISLVLFAMTTHTLALTHSRSAMLAIVASVTTIFFIWKKKWAFLIIALSIGFVFLAPFPLAKSFKNSFNYKKASSGSVRDRLHLWKSTLSMIKERPLLGWGLNNYSRIHPRFAGDGDSWYPHNCYLHIASEVGILGLLAFLWILGAAFVAFLTSIKAQADPKQRLILYGFLGSFLAMVFNAFADTNLFSLKLVSLFWLMTGLGLSYMKLYKKT